MEMEDPKNIEQRLRILEKAVETLQIGVTVTDTNSRIVYVNPAGAHMHGYTVEELLGKDVGIYAPPDLRNKLSESHLKNLTSWGRESVNLRKDGSRFPVHITSDVVLHDGKPIGLISSCQTSRSATRPSRRCATAKRATPWRCAAPATTSGTGT